DGACARLGRVATLTWEDLPAAAARQSNDSGIDLSTVLSSGKSTRPIGWAVNHYLENHATHRAGWREFRDEVDYGGADVSAEFARLVGDPSTVEVEIEDWLATPRSQQPLKPVYLDWTHVAPGSVRSSTTAFSFATVKAAVTTFSVTMPDELGPDDVGGVVSNYKDGSNLRSWLVSRDGTVSYFQVLDGKVTLKTVKRVSTEGDWTWTLDHQAHTVTLHGEVFELPQDLPTAAGPAAYSSNILFEGMTWE
ncbi:MAG: hypothetical protein ACI9MC_003095, partial [Kiritimatiellia bacterium]